MTSTQTPRDKSPITGASECPLRQESVAADEGSCDCPLEKDICTRIAAIKPFKEAGANDDYQLGYVNGHGDGKFAALIEAKRALAAHDAEVSTENVELRKILANVTTALGTGAFASAACSIQFLRHIPGEVRLTVEALRAKAGSAS